jgi:hypothetical protein
MSYGYYIFDELVQDLTADEEGWIRDQCSGEFETCKFIHDFMAEYDEVIDSFYWPKNVGWPYEEDALEYQEEELAFIDFQWEIVKGAQGHRHLRFRDHETLDPPLPVAELIRRFLHKWRPNDTFSMKYSIISSDGDGSPGAFYITAERVEWLSIGDWLFEREREWRSASGEVCCEG